MLAILAFAAAFVGNCLVRQGRRTVTTWLRAAGISDDYQGLLLLPCRPRTQDRIGGHATCDPDPSRTLPLPERLLLVIDDSPTKRYGPKVEGADVHHNPTPGPADQPFLYGHIFGSRFRLALRHPKWGPWHCRCGRCSMCGSKRWRRFPRIAPLGAIRHQVATGSTFGGVDRSDREKSGKNRLDRDRRRLHQAAILDGV